MKALQVKRTGLRSLMKWGLIILGISAMLIAACSSGSTEYVDRWNPGEPGGPGAEVPVNAPEVLGIVVFDNPTAPSYQLGLPNFSGMTGVVQYRDRQNGNIFEEYIGEGPNSGWDMFRVEERSVARDAVSDQILHQATITPNVDGFTSVAPTLDVRIFHMYDTDLQSGTWVTLPGVFLLERIEVGGQLERMYIDQVFDGIVGLQLWGHYNEFMILEWNNNPAKAGGAYLFREPIPTWGAYPNFYFDPELRRITFGEGLIPAPVAIRLLSIHVNAPYERVPDLTGAITHQPVANFNHWYWQVPEANIIRIQSARWIAPLQGVLRYPDILEDVYRGGGDYNIGTSTYVTPTRGPLGNVTAGGTNPDYGDVHYWIHQVLWPFRPLTPTAATHSGGQIELTYTDGTTRVRPWAFFERAYQYTHSVSGDVIGGVYLSRAGHEMNRDSAPGAPLLADSYDPNGGAFPMPAQGGNLPPRPPESNIALGTNGANYAVGMAGRYSYGIFQGGLNLGGGDVTSALIDETRREGMRSRARIYNTITSSVERRLDHPWRYYALTIAEDIPKVSIDYFGAEVMLDLPIGRLTRARVVGAAAPHRALGSNQIQINRTAFNADSNLFANVGSYGTLTTPAAYFAGVFDAVPTGNTATPAIAVNQVLSTGFRIELTYTRPAAFGLDPIVRRVRFEPNGITGTLDGAAPGLAINGGQNIIALDGIADGPKYYYYHPVTPAGNALRPGGPTGTANAAVAGNPGHATSRLRITPVPRDTPTMPGNAAGQPEFLNWGWIEGNNPPSAVYPPGLAVTVPTTYTFNFQIQSLEGWMLDENMYTLVAGGNNLRELNWVADAPPAPGLTAPTASTILAFPVPVPASGNIANVPWWNNTNLGYAKPWLGRRWLSFNIDVIVEP